MEITATLLQNLSAIAVEVGKAILEVYHSGGKIHVSLKADHTPLTVADRLSHDIIMRGLNALDPAIPVLSEEGADIPYEERRSGEYFGWVDPWDGSKEFISRRWGALIPTS